jgi:hypothetical protein
MLFGSPEVRLWFQIVAIGLLALAAWRVGDGPERILAGVLVGLMVLFPLYHLVLEGLPFMPPRWLAYLLLDSAALAVALAVALRANRIYPLWFAAFQLLAVLAHLARELATGVARLAYMMMYIGPSYCQILLLAGGIWFHRRRVARFGPYRAWRSSSPHSPATPRRSLPNG